MNTLLFFRYGIRMLYFFSYLVKEYKYWKQSANTANIVLLSVNQIADIFFVLAIMDNMCIANVWQPGCNVINFEINLIFLIKLFLYMTKKSRQNLKYLENEKSFWG